MKGFRVASEAPTAQHIALTCTQIVVFWSFFLFVLPAAVEAAEHALELPAMALRSPHLIGGILFGLASCVGLLSAMVMALAGITQGIAAGIWRDSSLVILYALCGGLLWHNLARPPEERDLEARFGQQFVDYRDRVGIWLPHLGSKAMERFVGITMPIASLVLTFWLPAVQAVPLIATTLLLGGYLAIRPAKSTNSGHSSSKSDSNAT